MLPYSSKKFFYIHGLVSNTWYIISKEYPDYDYEDPRESLASSAADSSSYKHHYHDELTSRGGPSHTSAEPVREVRPTGLPNGIPENIEFYEPETKDPSVNTKLTNPIWITFRILPLNMALT